MFHTLKRVQGQLVVVIILAIASLAIIGRLDKEGRENGGIISRSKITLKDNETNPRTCECPSLQEDKASASKTPSTAKAITKSSSMMTIFEVAAKHSPRRLSHVVMPLNMAQLPRAEENVKTWSKFVPCLGADVEDKSPEYLASRPNLLFYVSHGINDDVPGIVNHIVKHVMGPINDNPKIRQCFSRVSYKLIKLPPEHDNHVTGARVMYENFLKHEKSGIFDEGNSSSDGSSSGTNSGSDSSSSSLKSNHTSNSSNLTNNVSYCLYMEPDLRPIQSEWLTMTQLGCLWPNEEFWIKGSIFRGDYERVAGTDYPPNLYHINGNSIYNLSPGGWPKFYLETIRPYIIGRWGDSRNAYDTDVWEYVNERSNYPTTRHIMGKFVYSDLIQNMWMSGFRISDFVKSNPNTYFVHGGYPNYN